MANFGLKLKHFFLANGEKMHPIKIITNYLIVCLFVIAFFWVSLERINITFDFKFLLNFSNRIWDGFLLTIALSLVSLIFSFIIGLITALGQDSKILILRYLCSIYVKIIRGTPLIMQIYLFFYIIGTAWGIDNRFLAGALILSIFEGAYISEIIRGSVLSLDSTQHEAAKAVGFSPVQSVQHVVLPQLVARTLPALTGQFASIIKDSSLLSMIAVIELTQTMREISATNFKLFECYLFLGVLYLCLTLPISFISKRLERRFDYDS